MGKEWERRHSSMDKKSCLKTREISKKLALLRLTTELSPLSTMATVTASSVSKQSPITSDYLVELLQSSEAQQLASSRVELIKYLLGQLQQKSSKHKFLAQVTSVIAPDQDIDLEVATSFGAVWDSDRDGYISVRTGDTLVTVSWVFID